MDRSRLRTKDIEILITDNKKARKDPGMETKNHIQRNHQKTVQWHLKNGKMWGYEKTHMEMAILTPHSTESHAKSTNGLPAYKKPSQTQKTTKSV